MSNTSNEFSAHR